MRFLTAIVVDGNNTGIEVPDEVMSALGTARRYAVSVKVAGYSYRSSVAPYKGRNMISLSAAHRSAAGVSGGDTVEVEVELDTSPREVIVPAILAAALQAAPREKAAFDALSYTNRNRIATSVDSAKSDETRARRLEAALEELGKLGS
ncbi:YdeI/OmpD-associated family protein [Agreia sp. COWG]|uniref:YdeI/OmpD-associated family protein n=1 Tax=Agreia sp. COWG TaxID=2773266 RepID=UPI001925A8AE|nr:YdeI/OmpD-associated family protein [Agreia sp. COWG]CAD5997624.1 conserved protein of unknown function [Agreia sp. COWG]